jgi:glycosyltransferase involved in cell wall biosynthesis
MVSDAYFPRINSLSTSIQTLAQELVRLDHEVILIAPDYGEACAESFEVIRIPSNAIPMDPEDRLMSYGTIKRLVPDLKQRGFDLLHIHTPFVARYAGIHLSKQLGITTIETHGLAQLESVALGTPMVSLAGVGVGEVLLDGDGCMALDREINDYSTKVISLLSDDERHNELANSTEEGALQCSTSATTQKMIAIYYLARGEWSTLAVGTHTVPSMEP